MGVVRQEMRETTEEEFLQGQPGCPLVAGESVPDAMTKFLIIGSLVNFYLLDQCISSLAYGLYYLELHLGLKSQTTESLV